MFEIDTPINKSHLQKFNERGYVSPLFFAKSGIFHVQMTGLVATAPFGTTRVSVKCGGKNCDKRIAELEILLGELTNKG